MVDADRGVDLHGKCNTVWGVIAVDDRGADLGGKSRGATYSSCYYLLDYC